MRMELLSQDPSASILYLAVSIIVTVLIYAAFPMIYAWLRKRPIKSSAYRWTCYGFNLLLKIILFLEAESKSFWPYMLWTSVFIACGTQTLKKKSVLVDTCSEDSISQSETSPNDSSPVECATVEPTTSEENASCGKPQNEVYPIKKVKVKMEKRRYCKFCGGSIDSSTKKCTQCGKQYFRLHLTVHGSAPILFLITTIVLLCVFVHDRNQNELKISHLEEQISILEDEIATKDKKIEKQNERLAFRIKENQNLSEENMSLSVKAMFYDENIVFVLNDDRNTFHKIDCKFFNKYRSKFLAYDTKTAIARGIKPCPYCCD